MVQLVLALLASLLTGAGAAVFLIRRILLFPVYLRRKFIMRGIQITDLKAKALSEVRPHAVEISFVINSLTVASVRLKRMVLSLYSGADWEIARLDLQRDSILPMVIKGRDTNNFSLRFYPPALWWLENYSGIRLETAFVEVESTWGNIQWNVHIERKSTEVERIEEVRQSYLSIIQSVLSQGKG